MRRRLRALAAPFVCQRDRIARAHGEEQVADLEGTADLMRNAVDDKRREHVALLQAERFGDRAGRHIAHFDRFHDPARRSAFVIDVFAVFDVDGDAERRAGNANSFPVRLIIGDDVPSISEYCFSGCSNLSDVHIGTSVTTIGHYAFDGCSNINSFTIPKNVIYLGQAFYGCTGLENLIIEDGDEDLIFGIDYYITNPQYFKDSPIKTLYLGRNTAYRYTYANPTPPFSNLTQLKEVTIGNPVTMIKDYGFTNCSSLENITISANVAKIGENAFEGCSNLSNIYSLNPIPPQGAGSAGFTKDQYVGDVVVYVPKGSLQSYLNDNGWKNFWDIREFETTGIDNIQTSGVKDVVEIARYSIDGRRLSVPQKGLNIVVMSDGSKRKVMVK